MRSSDKGMQIAVQQNRAVGLSNWEQTDISESGEITVS